MLVLVDPSELKVAVTPGRKDHVWGKDQTLCGREVPHGTFFGRIQVWDMLKPARRCKRCDALLTKVRAMQPEKGG